MRTIGIMVILAFVCTGGYGQTPAQEKPAAIEPYLLRVTCLKTTALVFPLAVKGVDRGSRDVLVQKAEGTENVLWVKAARKEMEQASLTVITADGKLYTYLVEYHPNPPVLTLRYPGRETAPQPAALLGAIPNEDVLRAAAAKVAGRKSVSRGDKCGNAGITLQMEGIHVYGDALFCRVNLANKTDIGYSFDPFHFTIRDKKQPRRTAAQERGIRPLLVHNGTAAVKGRSAQTMVFALPKFTIPDGKYLAVEVMEQNGGRHLTLRIKGKAILRAMPVAL